MKINFLFLLVPAIIFFNGCATTRNIELTAAASPDQKTDPYGAVVSKKRHMVSMSHYNQIAHMENNAIFIINIENRGEEPLTIGNEDISMIFEGHDKKHTVKKLDVQSTAKLMQDVDYEYRKRMISYLVQISYQTDLREAYALSDGGPVLAYFHNVIPGGGIDTPLMSEHIIRSRVINLESTMMKHKTLRELLPDLIFDQKTINPHNSINTIISCRTSDIPRRIKGNFKINVSIDGEEHVFTFTRK